MAEQTLGNLTVTWLTKYIDQRLKNFPVEVYDSLKVGVLEVTQKLVVDKDVDFTANDDFSFIGSQGKPGFQNSWVNYGAPYSNAGYLKRADGWVELIGMIKSGTVPATAFTLPPGYRPKAQKLLTVISNTAIGRIDIQTDGQVIVENGSTLWVSLDGLHFKAA